jgi:hypothetical protein
MTVEPVNPQQPPVGWVRQRVTVYEPRAQSPERGTVGVLRAANNLGATIEVPEGVLNFYPWSAVSRIQLHERAEETHEPTHERAEETHEPTRGTWRPGVYPLE